MQARVVVGEELDGRRRADAAGVERRRVDVAPLHEAEHLPGVPAHLERLAVELAREGVERPHDVADRLVAVGPRVRRLGPVGLLEHARVGLGDHLLAEVHADEVLLEDVVVEHVLGGLAEIHDLLAQGGGLHPVRHVLGVAGAGGVVVATDPADPARDEVRVPGVLPLHEHAVAPEDRGRAVALRHFPLAEVDLGVDAQAAHDAGDGIPRHLHQPVGVLGELLGGHAPYLQIFV